MLTRITWEVDGRRFEAREPTAAEVVDAAGLLTGAYNHPSNAPLLGHTEELEPDDVIDHYTDSAAEGARQFLLLVDGVLAGDADLRGFDGDAAEFAFLIAAPGSQGQGLGTRFALMLHWFAFAPAPFGVELERVYASVVPANTASLRVFAKLGYVEDPSEAARAWADEPGDVVLAIDRATFLARHADALAAVDLRAREDAA